MTDRTVGNLGEQWAAGLAIRAARLYRSTMRCHVIPHLKAVDVGDLDSRGVSVWLYQLQATGEASGHALRNCLVVLSSFMRWCVDLGYAAENPVVAVPRDRRPRVRHGSSADVPWVQDDGTVVALMAVLRPPVDAMFYLGNRCGLRTGEICGLRLSDLEFLGEGTIRVRYSYSGPLKEDRGDGGKCKWVPAPFDILDAIGARLEARLAMRPAPGPEDFVFLSFDGGPFTARRGEEQVRKVWQRAVKILRKADPPIDLGSMTWYQATRHSFASRNLSRGATLEEVSSAMGHSSPAVTQQYYNHFIRRSFSDTLRVGLVGR